MYRQITFFSIFRWVEGEGCEGLDTKFNYVLRTDSDSSFRQDQDGKESSMQFDNLRVGTNYYVNVKVSTSDGSSSYSKLDNITTKVPEERGKTQKHTYHLESKDMKLITNKIYKCERVFPKLRLRYQPTPTRSL
jgi:hypothetical protein